MPDEAYDIVRQIKDADGRIAFLSAWITEIKDFVTDGRGGEFDGREFTGAHGARRLRVTTVPAQTVRRFSYQKFVSGQPRATWQRYVRAIPPEKPKTFRLAAGMPGKCLEWDALAKLGEQSEAAHFQGRHAWRESDPEMIARGLFTLDQRVKEHEAVRAEQREALLDFALAHGWRERKLGKADGRVLLSPAKPTYELAAGVKREDLLRAFPVYVTASQQRATTKVGFYAIGEDPE